MLCAIPHSEFAQYTPPTLEIPETFALRKTPWVATDKLDEKPDQRRI